MSNTNQDSGNGISSPRRTNTPPKVSTTPNRPKPESGTGPRIKR